MHHIVRGNMCWWYRHQFFVDSVDHVCPSRQLLVTPWHRQFPGGYNHHPSTTEFSGNKIINSCLYERVLLDTVGTQGRSSWERWCVLVYHPCVGQRRQLFYQRKNSISCAEQVILRTTIGELFESRKQHR